MAMMRTRYVPLPSRGRIGAARAAEHGLCSRSSWAEGQHIGPVLRVARRRKQIALWLFQAKRRPLHAGVARRAGAAQEDRRDLEEAADQRMRAEFVEEDLLLARQQLQLALAQQETAQAQVKTAQARAEESGDAKKVQAAERKVERAKKEVQEAKKEDSLGPQVARWHLWRGAGRFNQQLRWRCSLQWPSSAWVLGTLRGLNFPDRPACF
ncbi:unnamed protein product [Effrenium voratum]|nr:unnamed protein product [Effrenium voratum]